MVTTHSAQSAHHGRNVKRFREMFGIKQEALALELGDDWSQKKVSRLEENEIIADDILAEISKILKVPVEAIKNFDEETAITFIGNTFTNHDNSATIQYRPVFNALDKYIEAVEENKKLYERLLASEREKIQILQEALGRTK